LVLLYSCKADVPVSAHRTTIQTIIYCDSPQRRHVTYRDITRKLIKNVSFHVLPNASHHTVLFTDWYWQQRYIQRN